MHPRRPRLIHAVGNQERRQDRLLVVHDHFVVVKIGSDLWRFFCRVTRALIKVTIAIIAIATIAIATIAIPDNESHRDDDRQIREDCFSKTVPGKICIF